MTGLARCVSVGCLLLVVGTAACRRQNDAAESAAGVAIPATRTSLDLIVPAKGHLEAMTASPVAVPRVPTGALKIRELVLEGSIVEAGQIVIVFDDTNLNIELGNHRASFRSADRRVDRTQLQSTIESGSIDVMKAVAELERDNAEAFAIVDESIYSKLEILETTVRHEEAEETILFADASLLLRGEYYDIEERILDVEKGQVGDKIERVETSLASLVLKAPIGGLVVYKKNWRGSSAAVGDTLWPGNVVMSIVDPASTALTAFVLERDAAGLQVGSEATVTIDARSERSFTGKVATVAELSRPIERGSPVKYTEVKIEIEDGDSDLLKPGMKGEARIVVGRIEDAVVVPRSAVLGKADDPYVLIATPAGHERRAVELGPGDAVRVSIDSGVEPGERVLLGVDPDQPQRSGAGESAEPAAGV